MAVCISINVPAGVFVPSFIIGAAGGRLGMSFHSSATPTIWWKGEPLIRFYFCCPSCEHPPKAFTVCFSVGEIMVVLFPEGMRGPDGPLIYPGLYAVVGGWRRLLVVSREWLHEIQLNFLFCFRRCCLHGSCDTHPLSCSNNLWAHRPTCANSSSSGQFECCEKITEL